MHLFDAEARAAPFRKKNALLQLFDEEISQTQWLLQ
jgi:hypothetical protein